MRKGIVLAGGSGTRLHPVTKAISKQLLPIYDKPMVYYPISLLMLSDIRELLVISTPHDLPLFQRLLGDGSQWGIKIEYAEQAKPNGLAEAFIIGEAFLEGKPAVLVLGDNLFYGEALPKLMRDVSQDMERASIFAYHVSDPNRYGVVEFDKEGKAISIEEKPKEPKSFFAVPGIYFYPSDVCEMAKKLAPSKRGELEITDLNLVYLDAGRLHVEQMGRGTAWFDTGTFSSLLEASNFVASIQNRQGLRIADLQEIAAFKGWV